MIRYLLAGLPLCVLLFGPQAHAQPAGGFAAAFEAALANDAEYRAARHELEAREQVVPISRAGLLPNVGANYSESRVRGERDTTNVLGQPVTQSLDYRNPVGALQLRAPLLNLEGVYRYRSAKSQADGARSAFVARGQELLDRLGTAYVQRLFSEEVVALAQAQLDAFKAQSDMAERRFALGEGTRTEVAEAAASLSVARAQRIEAIDQRDLAQRTLARITGIEALPLRGLAEDARSLTLPYGTAEEWIGIALERNAGVVARQQLLESARHEVQRNRAGHAPRIDLIASAVNADNESLATLNQHSRQYSAGFQVSIPIFSGGAVQASVTQALAEAARIEAQLDNDRRVVAVDIRRQHQATESGRAKAEALREAVTASAVALEGAQKGLAGGVRTTIDVLDAVRRLYLARRDFVQARYEVLIARLRLQALAGLPIRDIVGDIDAHLTAPMAAETGSVASARTILPDRPAVAEASRPNDSRGSGATDTASVLAAVEQWRTAWSARDAPSYLAMYSAEFRPSGGLPRGQWEAQRRARLAGAGFIEIGVRDAVVDFDAGIATARFTQVFESDSYRDAGRKSLVFVRESGRWLIRQEIFEK